MDASQTLGSCQKVCDIEDEWSDQACVLQVEMDQADVVLDEIFETLHDFLMLLGYLIKGQLFCHTSMVLEQDVVAHG